MDDVITIKDAPEEEPKKLVNSCESLQRSMGMDKWVERDKEKGKDIDTIVKTIPWPPPHFPHRLKYKKKEAKYKIFISMLKELGFNFPLLKALEWMPRYTNL